MKWSTTICPLLCTVPTLFGACASEDASTVEEFAKTETPAGQAPGGSGGLSAEAEPAVGAPTEGKAGSSALAEVEAAGGAAFDRLPAAQQMVPSPAPLPATQQDSATAPMATSGECPSLPAPESATREFSPADVQDLAQAVRDAAEGTALVLSPGTYSLSEALQFRGPGVTLRSTTGKAGDVILDAGYQVNEPVYITASNVTIAHVTIQRAVDHPVKISPAAENSDIHGVRLYGVRIVDGGEQFVKINSNGERNSHVDNGEIACSSFELTAEGRPRIERNPGGCYTGGIDAHAARGWKIHHNDFRGIYCAGEGLAEHAIHFWRGSRDTLIENNRIINCARGIGLGLGQDNAISRRFEDAPYGGAELGHVDGVVRNNVIFSDIPYYDTGIEIQAAKQPLVVHNTVISTEKASGFFSSIDYRFPQTDVIIRNNLTRRISVRNEASGEVENNLEETPLSYFVDASGLDFHLTVSAQDAIDQGAPVEGAGLDIDGQAHDTGAPDLGADERRP